MLHRQNAAEVGQPVGALVERPEDCLTVDGRERHELAPRTAGVLERARGVGVTVGVETPLELANEAVGDIEAGNEQRPAILRGRYGRHKSQRRGAPRSDGTAHAGIAILGS